uniref:Uncharacterized protein n=1 Tax=Myotis myotis TaxID=51298 RepID=A0A7J8ANJ2_MYOMY|nr:hypothetical protein mMyoMyo1_008220 [Myotis myotis]
MVSGERGGSQSCPQQCSPSPLCTPPPQPCEGGLCLQGKVSTGLHPLSRGDACCGPARAAEAAPGAPSANQDRRTGSDPTSAGPAALCPQPQRPHLRHGGKEHPPERVGIEANEACEPQHHTEGCF